MAREDPSIAVAALAVATIPEASHVQMVARAAVPDVSSGEGGGGAYAGTSLDSFESGREEESEGRSARKKDHPSLAVATATPLSNQKRPVQQAIKVAL